MSNVTQRFQIIKQRGTPHEAITLFGDTVFRQDKLFVIEMDVGIGEPYTGFIPCADYDNHFIYEVEDKIETRGLPAFMCTCGAIAVVSGHETYKQDQSFSGLQFVCMFRNGMLNEETGELIRKHADGSS